MAWARGRERVDELLNAGELERVEVSSSLAARLLTEARAHHRAALAIRDIDPAGSFQLGYDGARKACAALLAVQGLRSTSRGGHVAVQDTVRAQFAGGSGGVAAFDRFSRMRRRRKDAEYPGITTPTIVDDELGEALDDSAAIIDASTRLLDAGRLDPF